MATITNSTVVESISRGGWKKNLYRYTLDNGEVHVARGWIASSVDDAADMATRGQHLLVSLAEREADEVIG